MKTAYQILIDNQWIQWNNDDKYTNRVSKMEKGDIWNKTANAIFQRTIEQVFGEDIKNMVCYQDDICIGATNENKLKKKTDIILNRLRNAGMTLNEKNA